MGKKRILPHTERGYGVKEEGQEASNKCRTQLLGNMEVRQKGKVLGEKQGGKVKKRRFYRDYPAQGIQTSNKLPLAA